MKPSKGYLARFGVGSGGTAAPFARFALLCIALLCFAAALRQRHKGLRLTMIDYKNGTQNALLQNCTYLEDKKSSF
jgi:hypothetical protein